MVLQIFLGKLLRIPNGQKNFYYDFVFLPRIMYFYFSKSTENWRNLTKNVKSSDPLQRIHFLDSWRNFFSRESLKGIKTEKRVEIWKRVQKALICFLGQKNSRKWPKSSISLLTPSRALNYECLKIKNR